MRRFRKQLVGNVSWCNLVGLQTQIVDVDLVARVMQTPFVDDEHTSSFESEVVPTSRAGSRPLASMVSCSCSTNQWPKRCRMGAALAESSDTCSMCL